jgi:hypothetical protein
MVRAVADLVAALSSGAQPVTQVRINEVLLALVRAKVVEKGVVKVRSLHRFLRPSSIWLKRRWCVSVKTKER